MNKVKELKLRIRNSGFDLRTNRFNSPHLVAGNKMSKMLSLMPSLKDLSLEFVYGVVFDYIILPHIGREAVGKR